MNPSYSNICFSASNLRKLFYQANNLVKFLFCLKTEKSGSCGSCWEKGLLHLLWKDVIAEMKASLEAKPSFKDTKKATLQTDWLQGRYYVIFRNR